MTKYKYEAPWWYWVLQIGCYVALVVAAVVTGVREQCPATELAGLPLNTWLLVSGVSGLVYAFLPFLVLLFVICFCFLPCLIAAAALKIVYYVIWIVLGIVVMALGDHATGCPVTLGFSIFGAVVLAVDIAGTIRFTKVNVEQQPET